MYESFHIECFLNFSYRELAHCALTQLWATGHKALYENQETFAILVAFSFAFCFQ